jgi:hypothetical protein
VSPSVAVLLLWGISHSVSLGIKSRHALERAVSVGSTGFCRLRRAHEGRTQRSRSGRIHASKPTTHRPTCAPPAHASVGSNETSEARGDGWAWSFQPPSRANTCILASAHGTPSSTRTSKRGEASRRSFAGHLMEACRSVTATAHVLDPHRARQYHAAGQARRRPKFCPTSAFCLGAT